MQTGPVVFAYGHNKGNTHNVVFIGCVELFRRQTEPGGVSESSVALCFILKNGVRVPHTHYETHMGTCSVSGCNERGMPRLRAPTPLGVAPQTIGLDSADIPL
jgi:hypothetical protein